MPVWPLKAINLGDGVMGRGPHQQTQIPWGRAAERERKSPGSPTLNPFVASDSPGLALPGCQRARLHPMPAGMGWIPGLGVNALPWHTCSYRSRRPPAPAGVRGCSCPPSVQGSRTRRGTGRTPRSVRGKERIQHEVAPSPYVHLSISYCSCKLLLSIAHLTHVDVGLAWDQAEGLSRAARMGCGERRRAGEECPHV